MNDDDDCDYFPGLQPVPAIIKRPGALVDDDCIFVGHFGTEALLPGGCHIGDDCTIGDGSIIQNDEENT
jgi:carbonic anhydrase/acetyltransferase-like protein (isoleucine patch superfamily)